MAHATVLRCDVTPDQHRWFRRFTIANGVTTAALLRAVLDLVRTDPDLQARCLQQIIRRTRP